MGWESRSPPPQGEGWWKSEVGEDRTDRPGPYQSRVPVREAAEALGISEGAVRMRVKRGTLPSTREGRRLYVLLETERTVVHNGVSMPGFTAEAALERRNVSYRTVGEADAVSITQVVPQQQGTRLEWASGECNPPWGPWRPSTSTAYVGEECQTCTRPSQYAWIRVWVDRQGRVIRRQDGGCGICDLW